MKKWLNGEIVDITFEEEGKRHNHMDSIPISTQIDILKQQLSDTDYIACKIIEGDASIEDYQDLIIQRKSWRREIRQLEKMEEHK